MKTKVSYFLVAACLFACTSFSSLKAKDIVDTAAGASDFGTLVAAVKAAELVETLKGKGPFTVFAPTDEAFQKLPKGMVEDLLKPENRKRLVSVLTYHVVPGKVKAEEAIKLTAAGTVSGQRLRLESDLGRLKINEANVVATNILCDNGVIHAIDRVLIPEEMSIPQVAEKAGTFKTLLAAVQTAELAETLGSEGPFTVFAPTDKAFSKLPAGTVESLLEPKNRKKLTDILTYHVVAGRVFSDDALQAKVAKTLNGQSVAIELTAKGIKIENASLVDADIEASNGVIHVIDSLLLPETLDSAATQELLQRSVSRGARAFNHGDYHECYEVYLSTCKRILQEGDSLPEEVPAVLQIALKRAEDQTGEQAKAWILRHGIDLAFFALDH